MYYLVSISDISALLIIKAGIWTKAVLLTSRSCGLPSKSSKISSEWTKQESRADLNLFKSPHFSRHSTIRKILAYHGPWRMCCSSWSSAHWKLRRCTTPGHSGLRHLQWRCSKMSSSHSQTGLLGPGLQVSYADAEKEFTELPNFCLTLPISF